MSQHMRFCYLEENFVISCFTGFFSNLGSGGQKKSSENDQLTGHFQLFF